MYFVYIVDISFFFLCTIPNPFPTPSFPVSREGTIMLCLWKGEGHPSILLLYWLSGWFSKPLPVGKGQEPEMRTLCHSGETNPSKSPKGTFICVWDAAGFSERSESTVSFHRSDKLPPLFLCHAVYAGQIWGGCVVARLSFPLTFIPEWTVQAVLVISHVSPFPLKRHFRCI